MYKNLHTSRFKLNKDKILKETRLWWKKWYGNLLIITTCGLLLLAITAIIVVIINKLSVRNVCYSQTCVTSASKIFENLNETVNPCDDFYQFSCGNYINKKTSNDLNRSIIDESSDFVLSQLKFILHEPLPENASPSRIFLQKLYDFCTNDALKKYEKIKYVKSIMDSIAQFPFTTGSNWNESNFNLTTILIRLREMGFPHDIFFSVDVDFHDSDNYYLIITNKTEFMMDRFSKSFLVDLALTFNTSKEIAEKDINDVLEFRNKILSLPLNGSKENGYLKISNSFTFVSEISWYHYLKNIVNIPRILNSKEDRVHFVYFRCLDNLFDLLLRTSNRVKINFIYVELIIWMHQYTHFPEIKIKTGFTEHECVSIISTNMPIAVSSLYVKNYVNKENFEAIEETATYIQKSYKNILKNNEWMDEIVISTAIDKLEAIKVIVGYPEELLDDKKIEDLFNKLIINLNFTNFLQGIFLLNKFNDDVKYSKINLFYSNFELVNYSKLVTTVAIEYLPRQNRIIVPAAFINVFFEKNQPYYLNYAVLGSLLARQFSHCCDGLGKNYNKNGFIQVWWNDLLFELYENKLQCILDQYKEYSTLKFNLKLDATLMGDKINADITGLQASYIAYKCKKNDIISDHLLPGLDYAPTQIFWIGFAQVWCSYDSTTYNNQEKNDKNDHGGIRVLTALSKIKQFADDFNCGSNSIMVSKKICV